MIPVAAAYDRSGEVCMEKWRLNCAAEYIFVKRTTLYANNNNNNNGVVGA